MSNNPITPEEQEQQKIERDGKSLRNGFVVFASIVALALAVLSYKEKILDYLTPFFM